MVNSSFEDVACISRLKMLISLATLVHQRIICENFVFMTSQVWVCVCVCVRSFPSPCFRVSCTLTPCAFINTRRILPIQSSLTSLKTVFWLLDIFLTYGYICRIWQSPPRLYLPDPVFKTKSIWSSLERVNSSLWNIASTGDDNS